MYQLATVTLHGSKVQVVSQAVALVYMSHHMGQQLRLMSSMDKGPIPMYQV
jgi:hypothetical protein